jgi:hypothetical protein
MKTFKHLYEVLDKSVYKNTPKDLHYNAATMQRGKFPYSRIIIIYDMAKQCEHFRYFQFETRLTDKAMLLPQGNIKQIIAL